MFSLIYRLPVNFSTSDETYPPMRLLLAVANLADAYGCLDELDAKLVAALYTAPELGASAVFQHPFDSLELAYLLKNAAIFSESLKHCVGRSFGTKSNESA